MAEKGGDLFYKCRMCGEVFSNVHVPDAVGAMNYILFGIPVENPREMLPPILAKYDIHFHKKGDFGVADFVGIKED